MRITVLPFSGMLTTVDVQHLAGHKGRLSAGQHGNDDLRDLPNLGQELTPSTDAIVQVGHKLERRRSEQGLLKTN